MTNKTDQIEISTLGKLAAHVPDIIVYGDFAQELPFIESFDGVLLFMDISGFTALTEKFSMNTSLDRGADELTQTLNHYMGDIVEGFVLLFPGDALLALWKVERCHLNEIITLALKCSFSIQQEYGVRDTEVGLELRVKIGVSAGHISKVVIGDNRRQHFVVTGRAVEEVRLAQNLAKASEIIMSPNCWELCDRNLIEVEKIKNERAVKVGTFLGKSPFCFLLHCNAVSLAQQAVLLASLVASCELHQQWVSTCTTIGLGAGQSRSLSCELTAAFNKLLWKTGCTFPNKTSACFIFSQPSYSNSIHLARVIDDGNSHGSSGMGTNSLLLVTCKEVKYIRNVPDFDTNEFFDRCAEYLNQNHICDSFEVLRIASVLGPDEELEKRLRKYVMKNVLKKIDDNQPVEYLSELRPVTVVFVNMQFEENANTNHVCKAIQDANDMIAGTILPVSGNINKVFMFDKGCTFLCLFGLPGDKQADESTNALDSAHKIHAFCSKELMKVKIVSIGVTAGPVFCGVVGHRVRHEYTVIGRKVNLAARMMMFYPGLVSCDALTYSKSKLPHYFFEELPLIEMKGVVNPGTVYQFLGITEKAFCYIHYLDFLDVSLIVWVVAMELTKINAWQNFFAVRTLMAMFLGVDVCKTYDARQYVILSKLRGILEEQYLCLLNNLFHVKAAEKEVIIFAIDEAQYIDKASWDFLDNLLKSVPIFIVMALSPLNHKGRILCSSAAQILNSPNTTFIRLRELSPSVIIQKACQDLGVVRIALAALDNMNPSEQMVVKCAAVIGVTFATDMLLYILPEWTKRKMYQTLAALVESRIFKSGSKRKEVNAMRRMLSKESSIRNSELKSQREESDLGSVISNRLELEETVMHCKIMEFCTPLLQEAAYELWLKNQKKALHFKCANYLKWLAHRCKCCGEGDFIPYHRYAVDGMLQKFYSQDYKIKTIKEEVLNEAALILVSETLKKLEASHQEVRELLVFGDYHIEYRNEYFLFCYSYLAFTYLNTAENLLRPSDYKHKLISQFEVSVLYSLKGEVSYNMGQITSAKKLIKKALSLLKKSFPITVVGAFCMFMVETSKHLSHQNKQTLWQISSGREKRLAALFQQSHCLSLLWQLFNLDVAGSRKTFTRLAALMQVNCAEESQDESQIISSYMDFSLCYQMMGCQHEWMKYELMAIKRSSHLQVVGGGLLTIAKLASSLSYMKLCLGNIPLAIQLGYRAHELYEQLKRPNLDATVLHDIFKALYLSTRLDLSLPICTHLQGYLGFLLEQNPTG
ncbi:PREDICTED: LOW QUALITY PROTEIN: adenylate cyclase type 10 [Thamnophis sirtalis]|uniref:LOW QUALITY PROTEIN: adenylate cyclase type 10 n=1 Tax=Thamnophis sirtalis TaxID=35019 RepID=A0A6I9X0W4_9SAUR|nr:PREDICTED: LOW QUALITY PROTEIN: adenylate cyclase type 10 [Thamnophis sirtalis]